MHYSVPFPPSYRCDDFKYFFSTSFISLLFLRFLYSTSTHFLSSSCHRVQPPPYCNCRTAYWRGMVPGRARCPAGSACPCRAGVRLRRQNPSLLSDDRSRCHHDDWPSCPCPPPCSCHLCRSCSRTTCPDNLCPRSASSCPPTGWQSTYVADDATRSGIWLRPIVWWRPSTRRWWSPCMSGPRPWRSALWTERSVCIQSSTVRRRRDYEYPTDFSAIAHRKVNTKRIVVVVFIFISAFEINTMNDWVNAYF